jgi:hypothetical protein
MANNENLRPFQKGQSGNPNGRPKGVPTAKTILERFMSIEQNATNELTGELENLSVAEQMHLAQIKKAKEGDLFAYKEIIDRLEGKSKQSIELDANVEQNITRITVKKRDE